MGNLKPRFSNCGSTRHLFRVIWSLRSSSHIITASPCCAASTVHRLCWELKSWLGFARTNIRSYNIFLTHFKRALSKTSTPSVTVSGRARGTWKKLWAWTGIQDQELQLGATLCCTRGTTGHCSRMKCNLYHLYQAGHIFTLPDQSEMVLGHRELKFKTLSTIITKW